MPARDRYEPPSRPDPSNSATARRDHKVRGTSHGFRERYGMATIEVVMARWWLSIDVRRLRQRPLDVSVISVCIAADRHESRPYAQNWRKCSVRRWRRYRGTWSQKQLPNPPAGTDLCPCGYDNAGVLAVSYGASFVAASVASERLSHASSS